MEEDLKVVQLTKKKRKKLERKSSSQGNVGSPSLCLPLLYSAAPSACGPEGCG